MALVEGRSRVVYVVEDYCVLFYGQTVGIPFYLGSLLENADIDITVGCGGILVSTESGFLERYHQCDRLCPGWQAKLLTCFDDSGCVGDLPFCERIRLIHALRVR